MNSRTLLIFLSALACEPERPPTFREVPLAVCILRCMERFTSHLDQVDGAGMAQVESLCRSTLAEQKCCTSSRWSHSQGFAEPCR